MESKWEISKIMEEINATEVLVPVNPRLVAVFQKKEDFKPA